jgi:pimeloyl-ACP methyl ester carboxylesterase
VTAARFVDANGIRLHYLEHGRNGPTLVLTHGLSANAHFFDVVTPLLAPMRVLSVDLRGRGLSDKPDSGYSMADHAADVIGILDALGLDRVLLGGHSFGGLLTLYVAATAPERVERAVVLDVPAEVDTRVLDQIGPSLARLDQSFESTRAYLAFIRSLPYFAEDTWDEGLAAWYEAELEEAPQGGLRAHCRPEHIRQCVEATLTEDWGAIATRVGCPTLLVRTSDSFGPPGSPPIMSAEGAQRTLARLSRGELVDVPGNHITFAFGARAPVVAAAIFGFADRDRVAS